MIQKNGRRIVGKICLVRWLAVAGAVTALWSQSFISRADSTGTVAVDYATIREKTDTSSTAIGSIARGKTITIKEEVQDDSGTAWYQVYVDSNTLGYIRADLVDKGDGSAGEAASGGDGQNAASSDAQPEAGADFPAETAMDAQYATVLPEAVRVRSGPATSWSAVDRLVKDAQVIVIGQSAGSDGKTWYYVTFTGTDGGEKAGFVRSDLVTMGDMVPVPEEETPEEPETIPEPEQTVNKDYEVSYDQEEDGSYAWYIHDNVAGYKQKLQPLLDAVQGQDEEAPADAKVLVRQRIAIVALIFIVLALIVAVIVMALKLRDVYYEDYEDEDEDEEPEEDTASRRRQRREEEEAPVKRRPRSEEEEAPVKRRQPDEEEALSSAKRKRRQEETEEPVKRRRLTEEEESVPERTARRRSARDVNRSVMREVEYREDQEAGAVVKVAPKRKAKNFLLDDDEFEFEFLNMDDKDL